MRHRQCDAGVNVTSAPSSNVNDLVQARRALDLIERFGLDPDPKHYEIWYAYVRSRDRALVSALDDLINKNGIVTSDDMAHIFKNYSPSGQISETSAKAGAQLAAEIDGVCTMIELAIGSTHEYGNSLEDLSGDINPGIDASMLAAVVNELSEKTRRAVDENQTLEANLRESRNEMNALRETLEAVRTQSLTDALTGVANRRYFDNLFQVCFAETQKQNRPMSLMIIDIDLFKLFNNTHGHRAGDQVLRLVAATVRQNLPADATVARYGGEEFAVVMPGIRLAQAKAIADRIRRRLSAKDLVKVSSGESLGRITVSAGIAEMNQSDTIASLIERADRFLYAAKKGGRDRTICEETSAPDAAQPLAVNG